jgi:hypothetical protein
MLIGTTSDSNESCSRSSSFVACLRNKRKGHELPESLPCQLAYGRSHLPLLFVKWQSRLDGHVVAYFYSRAGEVSSISSIIESL